MSEIPEELERWRARRQAELNSPESWLGLVGLFWLEPGLNRVGSADDAIVRLPGGPACLGDLHVDGGRVTWRPVSGRSCGLQTDAAGEPSVVNHENWSFFIVDRDGRLAARVRDRNWAARKSVPSLDHFAYDPAWRIEAEWQSLSAPRKMEVPDAAGDLKMVEVGHQAVFVVGAKDVTLLPMSVSDKEVFFVFRDATSGRETYGAGRFLKVPVAVDGRIALDFNFACNPPCAFTAFATCPLPPPENWLPFAVPAGEKKWPAGG
jgi:hypothetical protein